jgi:hypothetical protein
MSGSVVEVHNISEELPGSIFRVLEYNPEDE